MYANVDISSNSRRILAQKRFSIVDIWVFIDTVGIWLYNAPNHILAILLCRSGSLDEFGRIWLRVGDCVVVLAVENCGLLSQTDFS